MAGSGQPRACWPWSVTRWPVPAGLSGTAVEPTICVAPLGRWPLKPMPAVGRPVAVARASAERRGGPLAGRAGRAGAVAKLRLGDFQHDGEQYVLRFQEKGGKSREIPVRLDLQRCILGYVEAACIAGDGKDSPLFRAADGRSRKVLTGRPLDSDRIGDLVKRRLKDAGLPSRLSPHSFRVTAITDLLSQGIPLEDVQYLAGHAEPRTTGLYDRRQKKVTRNIVERISI
jgi:integrase/recombinase XerD